MTANLSPLKGMVPWGCLPLKVTTVFLIGLMCPRSTVRSLQTWGWHEPSCTIRSVLIVIVEEGFSVLVVPEACDVAITLVVLMDMQPALNIFAQLNGGACDRLTKAAQILHVKQDEVCQVDELPCSQ